MTQTAPPVTAELPVAQPTPEPQSPVGMIALAICAITVAGVSFAAYLIGSSPAENADLLRYWPFVVVGVGVGLIITLIAVVRLHAFLALVLAAVAAGFMTPVGALVKPAGVLPGVSTAVHWITAIELTAAELGRTAGGIAIIIGLAAIIGVCLLESGSADKIVRRFLAAFGEKHAGLALLLATYVISIPIFFDTLFMLLVPIAQALFLRTGKNYMLFVLAICSAGIITHSMVIPHPGPLAMVAGLNDAVVNPALGAAQKPVLDIGLSIAMGLGSGLVPLAFGWFITRWANRSMPIEPPASVIGPGVAQSLDRPESELPSFLASITPIILPVLLIAAASFAKTFIQPDGVVTNEGLKNLMASLSIDPVAAQDNLRNTLAWLSFAGERHVAMLAGTFVAIAVLMRQKRAGISKVGSILGGPLETAAVIILITAAGGAFGAMLRNSGIADAIKSASGGVELNLILLSYVVAVVIRVAQGSATVAMMTTVGIIAPLMAGELATGGLPYHPVYLFLSIGYGAFCCSWMNDSGFWVVSRLSGMTESQTLKSWTLMSTVTSFAGLATTLVLAKLLPMV